MNRSSRIEPLPPSSSASPASESIEARSPRRLRLVGRGRPHLVRAAATPIHLGLVERRKGSALLLARFDVPPADLEPLLASLRPRAIDVRPLETVTAEVPTTLGRALRKAAATAFAWAGALGVLGALLGAVLMAGDAFLPPFGWIAGPLGGAAACAGAFGALGLILGALVVLLSPKLALPTNAGVVVLVRARSFDVDAIVTHVVEAGGTIAAVGDAT